MAEHDVLVSIDDVFARSVTADWLSSIARIALEAEQARSCVLSILITGDDTVRELNNRYAGEDHATDVLSFSLEEGEAFAAPPGDVRRLGEVIISAETARRQADEAGHFLEDELAHLLVHGILHLMGYDHEQPAQEEQMQSRERVILKAAGFAAH